MAANRSLGPAQGLIAAALGAAPGGAVAQTLDAAAAVRDPYFMSAIVVLCLLAALFVGVRSWHRSRRFERERQRLGREAHAMAALLDHAPGAFVQWQGGLTRFSPKAGELLGLPAGAPVGEERLKASLAPDGEATFARALAALRADGTPFDLALPLKDGRLLGFAGRRGAAGEGQPAADVLWLADRTEAIEDAAARVERDRLKALLDRLPFAVWRRDEALRLAYCNDAYAQALDTTPAEAVARGAELAQGAIGEGGKALARRASELKTAQSESQHVVVAGDRRLLDFVEQPLPEGGLAGHALDVTGLEATQAELARHIAAHGEVLEQLSTGIVIYGPDARVKFFNSAYADLFGLDEEFLAGEPTMAEVIEAKRERRRIPEHADVPSYKRETVRRLMSTIAPAEELLHLPDGATLRRVAAPHPFGGVILIYEDVTDRLVLERSYNTLIAVQRETLDQLYEGVAVFGGDGRLKLSNPAFARLWRLEPAALDNEPHVSVLVDATRDLFPGQSDWPAMRERVIGQVMEREARAQRMERPDGTVLDITGVPLPDGGMLFTYLDVTDSLQVERALRERNAALETADRLKSEFIANVSYELRTPLNAIIGFAEVLGLEYFGPLNERQRDYNRSIVEASQNLLSLINDILDIATIEAGYMKLQLAAVEIADVFARLQTLAGARARNRGLALAFDCPAELGPIAADERRLTQALYNLVSNSINFTPAGGRIEVTARRRGDEVEFAVADTGIGIAAEDQGDVFEKFVRGRKTGGEAGVGLGLSLVRRLVELHGGRVALESTPGVGTRVACQMPIRGASPAAESAGEPGAAAAGG